MGLAHAQPQTLQTLQNMTMPSVASIASLVLNSLLAGVIGGGLLLSTIALCNAANISRALPSILDEVKTANLENAIGPIEVDPYAVDCQSRRTGQASVAFASLNPTSGRCSKKQTHILY